jgi:aspartate racemase
MSVSREKIAGILGGMGPEATVDLMRRIIRNTPAADDSDHIRCIIDNNPKVPSRLKALLEGGGENPGPAIAEMGRRLESWGADFLAIACNTAHYYYQDVCGAVGIPVLNMVELAVEAAVGKNAGARRIGILASPAVRLTRLYSSPLETRGIEAVYPDGEVEQKLLALIREVKRGGTGRAARGELATVVRHFADKGVRIAISACTELGIILDEYDRITVLDAAEVLAAEIVRRSRGESVCR